MDNSYVINETRKFVKAKLEKEGSGHDWYHIERVCKIASFLAKKENADEFIVQMTALLHDIEDWKFNINNQTSTTITEEFLNSMKLERKDIDKILKIIKTMSYKGGVVDSTQHTIEGMIVQDADRLDAIGAIGIARAFTYGGHKNRLIYDPNIKAKEFSTLDEVKSDNNHTINHFYEKLLKLKDLMNTKSAKELAEKRHQIMERFLEDFYEEWNI